MRNKIQVAVVGAGVNGLTCATFMQQQRPDVQVTIFADKFLKETTSDGAAGVFRPGTSFSGPNEEVTLKWIKDSYNFFMDFMDKNPDAKEEAGIFKLRLLMFSTKFPEITQNHFLKEIIKDDRPCTEKEMQEHGGGHKYGSTRTTFVVECRKYLPYLMKKFQSLGGLVVKKKLESFDELGKEFALVINCSALGSKQLCKDNNMTAIRGQIFKVHAPWIKHAVYVDFETYIIPGTELVTLGGTRQYSNYDDALNPRNSEEIWEKCTKIIPSLKNAKVVREWVGLRPHRSNVRVEKETMHFPTGRTMEVVHNYGHGGYGVMASAGTSMHAVKLANEILPKLFSTLESKL